MYGFAVAKPDYYELLGVSDEATQDEIKKAYKRLAVSLHPDKTGNDADAEAKLKLVNQAYAVLSDPEKRMQYDTFGDESSPWQPGMDISSIEDFFRHFSGEFNGQRQANVAPPKGRDLYSEVHVSLAESYAGCKKEAKLTYDVACVGCKGSGDDATAGRTQCTACAGTGIRVINHGLIHMRVTCQACMGQGSRRVKACERCNGRGLTGVEKTFTVQIPRGVASGDKMMIQGLGAPGTKAPGDVYLGIIVERNDAYTREDDGLLTSVEVNVFEACVGTTRDIQTLDGETLKVTIPPGTQPSSDVVVGGKGMPRVNQPGHGDLRVKVNVKVPTSLSTEQLPLLRKLAKTM